MRVFPICIALMCLCIIPVFQNSQDTDNESCLRIPAKTIEALDFLKDSFRTDSGNGTNESSVLTGSFTWEEFEKILNSVGLGRGTITVKTTEEHWNMMVVSKKTKSTTRYYEHQNRRRSKRHLSDDSSSNTWEFTDEVQVHIDPNMFPDSGSSSKGTFKPIKHLSHFDMDKHPNELCLNASSLGAKYHLKSASISYQEMLFMCPEMLNQIAQLACVHHMVDEKVFSLHQEEDLSMARRVLAALVVTALIGIMSLGISFVLKLYLDRKHNVSEGKTYKRVITFFVSLAVGTLTGDAFLHLIPESLHSDHNSDEALDHTDLAKRMIIVVLTVYALYFLEKVLAVVANRSLNDSTSNETSPDAVFKLSVASKETTDEMLTTPLSANSFRVASNSVSSTTPMLIRFNSDIISPSVLQTFNFEQIEDENGVPTSLFVKLSEANECRNDHQHNHHHHHHAHQLEGGSRSLMVMIGDAFHNFIDGLAIGSAFSSSMVDGLATTIAVALHEMPHEVGDFVALVNNGVRPNQVLRIAAFSNSVALAGVGVGVLIGTSATESAYVLCTAAGCFIYVGFINMLPHAYGNVASDQIAQGLLHLAGIMSGVAIMALIAFHEDSFATFVESLC